VQWPSGGCKGNCVGPGAVQPTGRAGARSDRDGESSVRNMLRLTEVARIAPKIG